MHPPPPNPNDAVCGVERHLVEAFLALIRDNYQHAEKAAFLLEERARILNLSGVANLRDVLSHLATMLDPRTPPERRPAQLANAEEHLRRAITEPYGIALGRLRKEFRPVRSEYSRRIVPLIRKRKYLEHAPDDATVTARLTEIARLAERGRASKGKNLWNPQWEEAVASFLQAYEKLSALHQELLTFCNQHRQAGRERWQSFVGVLSVVGTLGTVAFGLLSLWFVLHPPALDSFRHFLGLAR